MPADTVRRGSEPGGWPPTWPGVTGLYSAPPAPAGSPEHLRHFPGGGHGLILEVREAHTLLATPTSTPICSLHPPGNKVVYPHLTVEDVEAQTRQNLCPRLHSFQVTRWGWTPAGLPVSAEASPCPPAGSPARTICPRLPQGCPGALPSSLPHFAHWGLFFIPHFSREGASS